MKQENQSILITGVAQSNERVSELLRNFGNNSPSLVKPELVEITAGTLALTSRDQRRVSNFSMRVGLKRSIDPKLSASSSTVQPSSSSGTIGNASAAAKT